MVHLIVVFNFIIIIIINDFKTFFLHSSSSRSIRLKCYIKEDKIIVIIVTTTTTITTISVSNFTKEIITILFNFKITMNFMFILIEVKVMLATTDTIIIIEKFDNSKVMYKFDLT